MAWQTPKTNWQSVDIPTKDDFNRIEGNISYIEDENRTPNDSATPAATGKLSTLLNFIVSMIKAITGKANWYTAPGVSLESAKTHMDNTNNPHNTSKSHVGLSNVDNAKQMPIAGGTFTGIAKAYNNDSYSVGQIRNIFIIPDGDPDPTTGIGDIILYYEPPEE